LGDYKVTESKITVEGDVVRDQRLYSGFPPPKLFANYLDYGPDAAGISDFWNDVRWSAPSAVLNFSGASRVGQARQSGVNLMGSHFLTPETQNSVHYFYAHSRNYAPDEPAVDEGYRTWQRNALKAEDSAVAEAIQRTMPFVPSLHIDMTLLSTDASGVRVNAILDQMAQAERES
jgi:vanillate O-demethylase monooxygenase subunit